MGGKTLYGSTVEILGPSKMIYSNDKPLSCGAKLWIETTADIVIEDECTMSDINEMKAEHKKVLE